MQIVYLGGGCSKFLLVEGAASFSWWRVQLVAIGRGMQLNSADGKMPPFSLGSTNMKSS